MGLLVNQRTGQRVYLEVDQLVGRSKRCSLRIDDTCVSEPHATFRWDGEVWRIRDLGSTNGTFVDGKVLQVGDDRALSVGTTLGFGLPEGWLVESIDEPCIMAVATDGVSPTVLEGDGQLALPSLENALVAIGKADSGGWVAELEEGDEPVTDGSLIPVAGVTYRICMPRIPFRTTRVRVLQGQRLAELSLAFNVSLDGEQIELVVKGRSREVIIAPSDYFETMRVLAMIRQADMANGMPAPHCGWIHREDVCKKADIDTLTLNVHVYRFRQLFHGLGVSNYREVVERRAKSGHLRFGIGQTAESRA